jgi:hypothetical protein
VEGVVGGDDDDLMLAVIHMSSSLRLFSAVFSLSCCLLLLHAKEKGTRRFNARVHTAEGPVARPLSGTHAQSLWHPAVPVLTGHAIRVQFQCSDGRAF